MKSSIRGSLKTGLGPPALGVGRSRGTLSANWGRRVPIQRVQLHVLVLFPLLAILKVQHARDPLLF
jgi:hypothetical protein